MKTTTSSSIVLDWRVDKKEICNMEFHLIINILEKSWCSVSCPHFSTMLQAQEVALSGLHYWILLASGFWLGVNGKRLNEGRCITLVLPLKSLLCSLIKGHITSLDGLYTILSPSSVLLGPNNYFPPSHRRVLTPAWGSIVYKSFLHIQSL